MAFISAVEKPLCPADPLLDAIRRIETSRRRMAVITDEEGILLGTLTDGDVRRCLLAGGTIETPVKRAMNPTPVTAAIDSTEDYLLALMQRANVMVVPLVSAKGHYVRLVHLLDLRGEQAFTGLSGFETVVIMTGNKGLRYRPVVQNVSQPVVDITGVPMLERHIRHMAEAGVTRCYLSVNGLSRLIENHFGNGEEFGIEIRYLREVAPMGSVGPLSLIGDRLEGPVLVMNDDTLTSSDLGRFYAYHIGQATQLSIGVVEHHVQTPYGVVQTSHGYVTGVEEKPAQSFLCNSGIYALNADLLRLIPQRRFDINDLIRECVNRGKSVSLFPIHEYWTEIGGTKDYEKIRETLLPLRAAS
ncbi:MAG: CBS domain-containing protein [Proteobacteria bacterium]|nr:CBS domain-containing protein [Pseudomonadota bacterium]